MKYDIKEMVKDGKKVRFVQYKHNELWYETECGFRFPVDISDTSDGVFLAEDKAILFIRYIRKAIKAIDEQNAVDHVNERIDWNNKNSEKVGYFRG